MRILGIDGLTVDDVALRAYCAGIIDGEAYMGANRLMLIRLRHTAAKTY